jgi:TM2 domain-containing membrane protein YozV
MNTYLIELKRSLAPQDLEILKIELERKKKSVVLAYLLWFWLSIFGLHKFYLGKIWQGLLYMIGPWVTIFSIFGGLIASVQPNAQEGGALWPLRWAASGFCASLFGGLLICLPYTDKLKGPMKR